jgi:hypothetical protein
LLMVKLSVEVPFTAMVPGEKPLLMVGGATTVTVAVLLATPVPLSVALTAPVVLLLRPAVVPVTLTVIAHCAVPEPLEVKVPPARLMLVLFAAAVTVPLHVLLTFGVVETERPEGRGSLKAKPLRLVVVLGLVMVKVTLTLVPSGMLALANALAIVGGDTTVRVAVLLVVPGPVSVELRVPVVLFLTPAVVPVTFTEIAHEPPAATVPALRPTVPLPADADSVPLQVLLVAGVLAT